MQEEQAEIAKAFWGDWREEHLFTLRQSLEAWRFHQNLMADCDQQIASRMDALEDRGAGPPPVTGKKNATRPTKSRCAKSVTRGSAST